MAVLEEFDDAPHATPDVEEAERPNFSPSPSPLKVPSMTDVEIAAKAPKPPTPGRQLTREEKMNARRRGNKECVAAHAIVSELSVS